MKVYEYNVLKLRVHQSQSGNSKITTRESKILGRGRKVRIQVGSERTFKSPPADTFSSLFFHPTVIPDRIPSASSIWSEETI